MKGFRSTSFILFGALFSVLVAVFFYKTIVTHQLPVPTDTLVGLYHPWRDQYDQQFPRGVPFKNFLITDPIRQQIPWRNLVIDAWKHLRAPGWDPYTFAGTPLDANIQAAPFYLFNVIFLLFTFPVAWTILIMLQPFLGGIFMYLYLSHLKRSPNGAFIGALTWAFGGFAIAWMTWGTIFQTALWLPLILLSLDSILERRTMKEIDRTSFLWSLCLMVAIAMTITAGHIQIAVYVLTFSAGYVLWQTWGREHTAQVYWVGIATLSAILFTIPQWGALLKFIPDTGRLGLLNAWKSPGYFLPWQHLSQFVAPDFFGNPATLNYWGIWNYGELVGYVGIAPLVFGLSALFTTGLPIFFSIALMVAFLFMLPSPLSQLPFVLHLPVLSALQPTRLMMVVDFCIAVLSAYGFDALKKKDAKRMRWSLGFVVLGIVFLWAESLVAKGTVQDAPILGHISVSLHNLVIPSVIVGSVILWYVLQRVQKTIFWKRVLDICLIVIIVVDLFRFGWKFTPFTPGSYFYPATNVTSYLKNASGPFRVMSLDDRILPPNAASYYGIETIEGYDPIALRRYENFLTASELGAATAGRTSGFNRIYTAHNVDSKLLPYLNVRYVLSMGEISRPFLRETYVSGQVHVYEFSQVLPRVYLADHVKTIQKEDNIVQALIEASPTHVGIVEEPVTLLSIPVSLEEHIAITSYQANAIRMQSETQNAHLAVILNTFDARWKVTIDGKPSRLMRVNYLLTGVIVPKGRHSIELTYR